MKRKGSKKAAQRTEDDSNGVEDQSEENGGAPEEVDEPVEESDEEPKQERRRRNVKSKSSKEVDESAEEESDEEPQQEKRKKSAKSKSPKKNVSFSKKGEDDEGDDDLDEEPQEKKKKSSKSSKKNKKAKEIKSEEENPENDDDQDEDDEAQYEVEKVLDEKVIRGVRHYLIRWKGYEEESDTWEPEDTLSCQDLIKAFKEAKKKTTKGGGGGGSGSSSGRGRKPVKQMKEGEEWDENEDFEVDKILEVHFKKGGKREFLVVWKGYGLKDSSWEPEENMNCKDLIDKFMAKVEVAKNIEEKDLRVNRKHVQRLTYNTPDSHRRLSKRNSNKERVQYHDAE